MRATITFLSFCCALFADDQQRTADQARRAYDLEVSGVIADAQDQLAAKREAFEAEIAAIREAADAAGDEDAADAAAEALADDDVIRVEPRRSLWVSDDGFFERLHEGHWIEKTPNGDANVFDESTRTADYVELSRPNAIVRLYDDRCDVRLLPAREFRTFYRGSWE